MAKNNKKEIVASVTFSNVDGSVQLEIILEDGMTPFTNSNVGFITVPGVSDGETWDAIDKFLIAIKSKKSFEQLLGDFARKKLKEQKITTNSLRKTLKQLFKEARKHKLIN